MKIMLCTISHSPMQVSDNLFSQDIARTPLTLAMGEDKACFLLVTIPPPITDDTEVTRSI